MDKEQLLNTETKTKYRKLAKPSKKWTAFLSYPIAEKDSALNITVLAHELAHLADRTTRFCRALLPLKLDKSSFDDLIRTEQIRTEQRVEAFRKCTIMVESWLRELIADAIAVHAIGPAYFLAFSEFLAHAALKNQPDTEHDAPSVRLELILGELRYLGYFDGENAAKSLLEQAKADVEQEKVTYGPYGLVVHQTIANDLKKIQTKIREFSKAKSMSYDLTRYRREVPSIVKRLVQGTTPAEIYDGTKGRHTPSSVAGILNAGWEVYKTHFSKFSSVFDGNLSSHDIVANLNQLMFHGIEASEVTRLWEKATG